MWFSCLLLRLASMDGNTVMPNMKAGSRIVLTTNERVRTGSRYSRRMISQVLRILLPHGVDEDLFERRFHQFKLVQARARRGHLQQVLGVGAGREPHFHVFAVV